MKGIPKPRHYERGTFSMKYSWEFKLECISKYKNGEHISTPGKRMRQKDIFMGYVRSWTNKYDDLGINGLKHSLTHKDWTPNHDF